MGLGVFLLALLWGVHLARGVPAVYLVNDSFGNFLLVKGASLLETALNMTADSLCTCRLQCMAMPGCNAAALVEECMAMPGCNAAALVEEGTTKVCWLSFAGLKDLSVTEHENSTFMLWNTTHDGSFWLGVDGRLYLTVSGTVNAEDSKAACSSYPGFRLGSFSSLESMAALKEFFDRDDSRVSIDLSTSNVWGDGVPYDQANSLYERFTPAGYKYAVLDGALNQKSKYTKVRLLCQADLANAGRP